MLLSIGASTPSLEEDHESDLWNPACRERAWSYYLTLHDETGRLGFEEAMEAEPEIFERGLYADQIENLLERCPRKSLLLLL